VNKTEHASAERNQNEAKGDKAPKKKKNKKPVKDVSTVETPDPTPERILEIQMAWSSATGGALLQEQLCKSLAKLGYSHPTPIQAATLSAAIMGRRNLVGAAPTGSGKTLAFLLPILQHLLEQDEADENKVVQALILTPTRELAQQIQKECENILPKQCISLTGGIALVKQARLLQSKPRVIVATPGRLWAMVSQETTALIAVLISICITNNCRRRKTHRYYLV
jgi:ATP-dependent RNA helicase DDX24/MAK5